MGIIKVKKVPPKTQRICIVCEKIRTFRYNPVIGHSECKVCGGRFAIKLEEGKKYYSHEIIELIKQKEKKNEIISGNFDGGKIKWKK